MNKSEHGIGKSKSIQRNDDSEPFQLQMEVYKRQLSGNNNSAGNKSTEEFFNYIRQKPAILIEDEDEQPFEKAEETS